MVRANFALDPPRRGVKMPTDPMSTAAADEPRHTPDQAAAHAFLSELRTRITTQPLPYQYGVEKTALESLWKLFDQAREAMKANPGCEVFARRVTEVLNLVVRPKTAKWHRALETGRLDSRDGADAFRGELLEVQASLREFAAELHEMAYGSRYSDALTPDAMPAGALAPLFASLPFGFTTLDPVLAPVAAQIKNDEAGEIRARRKKRRANPDAPDPCEGADAVGLALSGGGIRSATFSLGVVQVLAARGLLKDVDFLSTVSGGGYTGSFLTQRLGDGPSMDGVAHPHGPDPEPIRYVRENVKFLSGEDLVERWMMVTATLAGMFLNWTVPLLVLVVMALAASGIDAHWPLVWPKVFQVSAGLSLGAMVLYGWFIRRGRGASLVSGRILGALLAFTGATGLGLALAFGIGQGASALLGRWPASGGISALLALAVSAVPGVIRFVPVLKNPEHRKLVLKIALLAAGLLVPLLALGCFYVLCALVGTHLTPLVWMAGALAVVAFFILNINLTSPHRLYRDGLARTFIQKGVTGTPDVKLKEINPQQTAPYQIINAAQNVPSTHQASLRDRGCDFFIFSKCWMGSVSAGYHPTSDWRDAGREIDLATAMAVSGAAFSSHMGLGSVPMLTALLTLLNVRLGFWMHKPGAGGWFQSPGFFCLLREALGTGMAENAPWLNLSDGGHIENLAIYELLRRRCKFIVCVDGEADPAFTFHGLMTLVRHAQIDFGVKIHPRLDDVRADAETHRSKSHFHLCRIEYPEGWGLLLYIKLSVTGDESELIRRYRINHPEFPHQSTLDQFFDQEQFEAYRQLGVHAAESLFLPALMNGANPTSIPDWFRALAASLLEPA